jgi:uncharacterized protein YndB with AHSA1/START domain
MKEFHGTATARVDAPPAAVFDLITDIDRLPAWNAAIESVVDNGEPLVAGAEWVVLMHPRHYPRWNSRSRVTTIEPEAMRFVHRSSSDDRNPSYLDWTWVVSPDGDGALVTVSWDAYPRTIGRQLLAAPMRRRALAKEVPASLAALEAALALARG